MYLCGEVHAITCTQTDGVLQVAHGGLFGYNPKVNYMVGTVYPDRIELELKEISIINSEDKLDQVGDNRPSKTISIADYVKQKGFVTVGKCVLRKKDNKNVIEQASGFFKSENQN